MQDQKGPLAGEQWFCCEAVMMKGAGRPEFGHVGGEQLRDLASSDLQLLKLEFWLPCLGVVQLTLPPSL